MTDTTAQNWIGASLATVAAATSGTIATDPESAWYKSIDKPGWQPPKWVFPVVWTALYAGIAATSARTLNDLDAKRDAEGATAFRGALGLNLFLNQAWSWTYFKGHRLGAATFVAAALAGSSIDLARRAGKVDRRKGAELTPYAVWCSFATLLTAATWRRNPGSKRK